MLTALVLVCALNVAHTDCHKETALRYVEVPGNFDTPFQCYSGAVSYAADKLDIQAGEYPKIECSHGGFGSRVG